MAISNSLRKRVQSLGTKKGRREEGLFLVEGRKSVGELVRSGRFPVQWIFAEHWEGRLPPGAELIEAGERERSRLSQLSTAPEVIAVARMDTDISTDTLTGDLLLLDQVKDPGNVGTIIRVADWFGFGGVVLSPGSAEFYNPKTIQATMGSFCRIPVVNTSLEELIITLRGKNYNLYAAVMEGESIYSAELRSPAAFILGSESHGVSDSLLHDEIKKINIPSGGGAESLNVAVAAGILCSELFRRSL